MAKSKLLSIFLLAAILLQCAACGGSESVQNSDTTSADTAMQNEASAEYTVPDVDYDGRTVTMTGYNYEGPWVLLRYNVALEEENGDVINDAIVMRNRAVEEALNVQIELIPLGVNDRGSSAVLQKYIMAQEDVIQVGMQMAQGMSRC